MSHSRVPQRRDRPVVIRNDFNSHDRKVDGEMYRPPRPQSPSLSDAIRPAPVSQSIRSVDDGRLINERIDNTSMSLENAHALSQLGGKDTYLRNNSLSSFDTKSSILYKETELPGQILSANAEAPKVAIRRGLRSNWTLIAPHITAVFVTVAVSQLSFRNVFWMDLKPPESQISPGITQGAALNFLQIAAKLHELLILGSLSSIVLHLFQASLTGPSGLPLGMMANAFELGSGGYLCRKSFWTSLWSPDPATGKRFRFFGIWVLSLSATIIITLSGPSSAIAIIPALQYFDIPRPFNQTVFPLYIFNQSTELWPTQLTAASLNAPNSGKSCNASAKLTGDMDVCPTGGFRENYSWSASLSFGDMDQARNISYQDEQSNTRRVITAQSCNSTFDGRASSVGINAFLHRAMTSYWMFAQRNYQGTVVESAQPRINIEANTRLFAPRVEVLCNSYTNHHYDPKFPNNQTNMVFPAFDSSKPIPVPDWSYKYARPLNASNFTFVQVPGSPFLGAVASHPTISLDNKTYTQPAENVACSIYSQWIPIDAFFEPTASDQVSYAIKAKLSDKCLTSSMDGSSGRKPINTEITSDYANAMNGPIKFVDGAKPAIRSMFERYIVNSQPAALNLNDSSYFRTPSNTIDLGNQSYELSVKLRARLISVLLAGVVTDGLARDAGNGIFPYSAPILLLSNLTAKGELQGRFPVSTDSLGTVESLNTTKLADDSKWLRLNLTYQRYGYGYRWKGNETVQFGITVLLIHIFLALIHVIYVLVAALGSEGGIERAWETIPELFTLAMNSRSSERLRNTCAGISQTETWREKVAIRETSEGHLEVVVGNKEMQRLPLARAGVKYGALPVAPNDGAEGD